MDSSAQSVYPRPDFVRSSLRWQSLNGPWDFLFDDEDIGQLKQWHQDGLPNTARVPELSVFGYEETSSVDNITQQIAAQPEKLLKNNVFSYNPVRAKTHSKRKIEVPYVFQTEASGINDQSAHEVLWYERLIPDLRSSTDIELGHRLLLRFGAVDYETEAWVNGQYVGSHRGGHVPFDLDISNAVQRGIQRLTLRIRDSPFDCGQPRGKQYWGPKPESIFYTPSSGIWQSVWLEAVPRIRIADSSHGTILCSNDIEQGNLSARVAIQGRRAGHKLRVEVEASLAGNLICKTSKFLPKETQHVVLDVDMRITPGLLKNVPTSLTDHPSHWQNGVAVWSPECPTLYDVVIRLFFGPAVLDEVRTICGIRSLEWTAGDRTFMLNGRPYFQALVLDQGYWPSTGLTPPSPESLRADIEISKQMGFNGCRKHQKVEDPIFLYWADKLGYLVWGEMANGYWFNDDYVQRYDQEWMDAVRRDINHPCIVTWTPVNESWGYPSLKNSIEQRNHIRSLYYMTKTLDPTRPINDNCGWEHVKTDLTTFHEYADAPVLAEVCSTIEGILGPKAGRDMFVKPIQGDPGAEEPAGAPILCTEFGGVNIAPGVMSSAGEMDWGYTTASDPQDLLKRLDALVMAVVDKDNCCGFVYTQLTDIEQEVNGLYTFDRTPKLDVEKVRAIMNKAKARYIEFLRREAYEV